MRDKDLKEKLESLESQIEEVKRLMESEKEKAGKYEYTFISYYTPRDSYRVFLKLPYKQLAEYKAVDSAQKFCRVFDVALNAMIASGVVTK